MQNHKRIVLVELTFNSQSHIAANLSADGRTSAALRDTVEEGWLRVADQMVGHCEVICHFISAVEQSQKSIS